MNQKRTRARAQLPRFDAGPQRASAKLRGPHFERKTTTNLRAATSRNINLQRTYANSTWLRFNATRDAVPCNFVPRCLLSRTPTDRNWLSEPFLDPLPKETGWTDSDCPPKPLPHILRVPKETGWTDSDCPPKPLQHILGRGNHFLRVVLVVLNSLEQVATREWPPG